MSIRPHIANNSGEVEWYTPENYINSIRKVLGNIDLDPSSSDLAQQTIKASYYFTQTNSGLDEPWYGKVFLNPPYSSKLISKFIYKLIYHYGLGHITEACVLVNNATETKWFQSIASVSSVICFPSKRIRFISPSGKLGSPLQGQAIFYLGNDGSLFIKEFSSFGICFSTTK